MIKKILLLTSILLTSTNIKSQNCNGVSCIANPNIQQEETVICYEDAADTNMLNWDYCNTESCIKVCELTLFTYTTPFQIGSSFNWSVLGGQLISTTPLGNSITILWDSVGSGTVSVIEQDSIMCSEISTICIDIISKPIADIITSTNSDTICQNSSIQFQALDLNNNTLLQIPDDCDSNQNFYGTYLNDSTQFIYELQYFWDFDDGSTSTEQNPVHVFDNPGSYTVSLSISNACQCYDVVTNNVIVINTPGPSITNCVGPLCEGDTAEYCTDAVLPDWTIVGGTIFNSTSTNNCIAVIWDNINNELDDGGGELLVGDLNSSCGQSNSFYSVPVVPSNPIIKGNTIACPGTLESYSIECIPGMDYSWSISPAWGVTILSGTNKSEFLVSFTQWVSNTSFQITLNMSSTTLKCIPPPVIINIDVLPPINGISVLSDVCEDATVNYFDWNGSQYNWTVINGNIASSSPNSQIDVIWDQGNGNGMIIVEPITSGIFCQTSKSYPVNIAETPISAINILGDSLICPGSTYIYSVEESNATSSSNISYNWTVLGGVASTLYGEVCTITWNSVGPYVIEVTNTLLSPNYCSSSVFTKTINTVPVVIPVVSGSSIACLNTISTFNLTTIYPSWAVMNWSVSNPILGSVVSGQGTSQVQVEWGNQSGTTNVLIDVDVCGVTYSSVISISFLYQSVSFSLTSNPICSESPISFLSTGSNGSNTWSFGDNTTSLAQSPLKTYNEPGDYLVSLTYIDAATQCISSYSSIISVEGIAGKLLPEGTSFYCSSDTISQPLYISTISTSSQTFEWFHNGSLVSTSNTYTVNSNPPNQTGIGDYSVILTDVSGCSNTLNIINIDTLNCNDPGNGWCGGGSGCPSLVPLTNSSSCNSVLGTMSFTFNSPNAGIVDWRVDNGLISSAVNYPITFDEAGIYKVKALSAGCLLGIEQITVPVVVDLGYSAVCDPLNGNQITYYFQDSSSYLLGYGTATFLWDFGDGNTSSLPNPIHVYALNGNYNVNLTVNYGSYSCNKTITVVKDDFNVTYLYTGLECENIPTITFNSSATVTNISNWAWNFGDGASSTREIPMRTYNPSSTYMTTLQITDVNGCVANASSQITIEQTPIISSVTNLGPFCSNNIPTNLNSIVTFTTSNGEVASWSGIGIYYDPVTHFYYFNPMLAGGGSHAICVTVTDNNGCYDTKCINIDVVCPEKPRIFGKSEYCYDNLNFWGNFISLQTQSIYSSYQWFENTIALGGNSNSLWSNPSIGVYDYMVEVIDNNGCTVMSEPFTINIHNSPNTVWVSTSSNLCPGEDIVLTHSGSQTGVDYYWNTLPQQIAPTVTVIAIADYEYSVTAINEFGCESVSYPLIVPSEIPMCGLLSGCLCDSEIINSSGFINIAGLNNSLQYTNYEWMLNGISISQTNTNLIIDPTDPNYLTLCAGEITLEVTDNNGCTSISQPLTIEPNCISCFTTNLNYNISQTICDGDSIVFGGNSYSTPGIYMHSFQSINGCDSNVVLDITVLPIQTSMQNIIICVGDSVIIGTNIYYDNGIYTDTFNSGSGCDSVLITEVVLSDPLANLSFSISSLTASVTGGALPYYFELGNQNGVILNSLNNFGTTISINPIINGLYYFFIIDANNCISDTVFCQVDALPSSLLDFRINDLFIYPNPSRGLFSISFESLEFQDFKISLYNIIGKEIFSDKFVDFSGKYIHKIDLSTNDKGIYILEIETNAGIINKKLILQ